MSTYPSTSERALIGPCRCATAPGTTASSAYKVPEGWKWPRKVCLCDADYEQVVLLFDVVCCQLPQQPRDARVVGACGPQRDHTAKPKLHSPQQDIGWVRHGTVARAAGVCLLLQLTTPAPIMPHTVTCPSVLMSPESTQSTVFSEVPAPIRPRANIADCAVSASTSCVSLERVSITVTRGLEMLSNPSPRGTARRMFGSPYCEYNQHFRLASCCPSVAVLSTSSRRALPWAFALPGAAAQSVLQQHTLPATCGRTDGCSCPPRAPRPSTRAQSTTPPQPANDRAATTRLDSEQQ